MGNSGMNWSTWWRHSSSSSFLKLLLFVIPLTMIAGFISLRGPDVSNWVSISSQGLTTPVASAVSNSVPVGSTSIHHERRQKLLDTEPMLTLPVISRDIEGAKSDSSSPSSYIHPAALLEHVSGTGVEVPHVNESNNLRIIPSSLNESYIPTKETTRRKARILQKVEVGLVKARAAIREATYGNQSQDPDYVPKGPMYWNANAFHRSYLEMEKQFKVFIYEEGEPPVFHNGPCKSIYSMEGNFIHGIEVNNQYRTRDPEKAHVYFLPFSVAMMVQFVYVRDSHDFTPIKKTVIDYLNVIAEKYPYWNRSLGADHFMLACHDWGPETSFSNLHLYKNSIRVLCNANTSEGFNPAKDASFPEINLQLGTIEGYVGGPSPSKRSILAFFAGGVHGPIRPIVLEHWENKDEDIKVHRYLPKGVSYYDMLRNSRYCLCPSGYEVASPRLVEAIYTGCVPVLISDHYVPPFSDIFNWKSFSVEVSVKNIPNLKRILASISTSQYLRMQRRVLQVRKHFEVHSPPKRFDVFHMILHSVWLRRLNLRIRADQ